MKTFHVAVVSRAVFPWHGFGGLERHVEAQVRHLVDAGCRITLFAPPKENAIQDPKWESDKRMRFLPIRYRTMPWPRRAGFVVLDRLSNYRGFSHRVADSVRAFGPFDVVHVHGMAGFGLALDRSSEDAPLVLHPHGLEEFKVSGLKWLAYAPQRHAIGTIARQADRVLIPDASMEEEVHRLLRLDRRRSWLIPNAVDIPAESETKLERWGSLCDRLSLARDTKTLVAVGRLEENKGFGVLLQALAKIRYRLKGLKGLEGWKLLVVGAGSLRRALEGKLRKLELDPFVRFVGPLSDEDLEACYRHARWFVHPTLYEGSSLVTLEAMAHRLPVVASRVGGIPDKVFDHHNGLLVSPGDIEELAAALVSALELPEEARREWGARSRERVEKEFSWTKRTERLLTLYGSLTSD